MENIVRVHNVWDWLLLKRTGVPHSPLTGNEDWCNICSVLKCSTPAAFVAKLHWATQVKLTLFIFFSPSFYRVPKQNGRGGVFLKVCAPCFFTCLLAFYEYDCFVDEGEKNPKSTNNNISNRISNKNKKHFLVSQI